MLYFNKLLGIKDYESFKSVRNAIAPIRVMGDGNKTQPKKLVWKLVTSKELFKNREENFSKTIYRDANSSISEIESISFLHARYFSENKLSLECDGYNWKLEVRIDGIDYGVHPTYLLDDAHGLCFDRDVKCIRHTNMETNRPDQKIKAGKWYRKMAIWSKFDKVIPDFWLNHLCEIFANKWETWAMASMPDVELVVDRDFESIYDRDKYTPDDEDFCSCMSSGNYGLGHHEFYEDSTPDAMAASIRDKNGYILARCVVFNNVKDDDTGEIFRLAERQYASGGKDVLKSLLVAKLYDEGYIDGHKRVGCDCCQANAFIAKDGTDMSDRKLSIICRVNSDSILCYQDSFKWSDGRRAYNYRKCSEYALDSTQMHVGYDDDVNWDEYHEEYTHNDVVTVNVHGDEMTCSEYALDDFRCLCYRNSDGEHIEGYYYEDDCVYCESDYEYYLREDCVRTYDNDEWMLRDDACYSDLLDRYYKDEDYMKDSEKKYAEVNGYVWDYYYEEWIDENIAVKVYTAYDGVVFYRKRTAERFFKDGNMKKILMDVDDENSLVYVTNEFYEQHFNIAA